MARRSRAADAPARASANEPQHIPAGKPVDFATLMPDYRKRHDGWNADRVQRFFDALRHTGCVEDACRYAGMSDVACYRARDRYPLFGQEWAAALAEAEPNLIAIAYRRAVEGRETVIIRKGEEHERRIQPSDSMLGLLIKRGDMAGGSARADPESVITRDEWQAGWRFDGWGRKYRDDPSAAGERVITRLGQVRERLLAFAEEGGLCARCNQPWPLSDNRSVAELVAAGVVELEEVFEMENAGEGG